MPSAFQFLSCTWRPRWVRDEESDREGNIGARNGLNPFFPFHFIESRTLDRGKILRGAAPIDAKGNGRLCFLP
jgi:hypothetical protein